MNECVGCLGEGSKGVSAVRVEAVSVISFSRYLWKTRTKESGLQLG